MMMEFNESTYRRIRRSKRLRREGARMDFSTPFGTAFIMKFPRENKIVKE